MFTRNPTLLLLACLTLPLGCSSSDGDGEAKGSSAGSGGSAGSSSGGTSGASGGAGGGSSGTAGVAGASGSSAGGGGSAGSAGAAGNAGAGATGGTVGTGGGASTGACTVADTSGCVPKTTLTFKDKAFVCSKPLSSFGPLPLKVIVDFTPGVPFTGSSAVDLTTGCAGDGDSNSIDLILDVRGDGKTYGVGNDAVKLRREAGYKGSIQITGHADCGPMIPGAHQDGVQAQGGKDVTFVDFSIGDFDGGWSTCQGGGGAFFYSAAQGYYPQSVDVVRGKFIACNHSLFMGGQASGKVSKASFRSGRNDGSDPVCIGLSASNPCTGAAAGVTLSGLTCEKWNATTKQFQ